MTKRALKYTCCTLGGGAGITLLGWLGYAAAAWTLYGRVKENGYHDVVLDEFMPTFEVYDRHEIRVAAPAEVTYAAAREMDLDHSRVVHAIFRGRELLMRAKAGERDKSQSFLSEVLSLGWGVLAEGPGREIVIGAVTRPWEANVRFRSIPPADFAVFKEPRYVKIVWNLSVEPLGPAESMFRTETRVATTDAYARKRFRRYWAVFSPGIRLIRRESLGIVKADAEHRVHSIQGER
jgi:hypothetical protein